MVVVVLLFIFSVVRYLLNFLKVPYSLLPFLGSALLLSTGEGRRTLTKDDDELFHLEIRLRVGGNAFDLAPQWPEIARPVSPLLGV
jgi:hypothetical protein